MHHHPNQLTSPSSTCFLFFLSSSCEKVQLLCFLLMSLIFLLFLLVEWLIGWLLNPRSQGTITFIFSPCSSSVHFWSSTCFIFSVWMSSYCLEPLIFLFSFVFHYHFPCWFTYQLATVIYRFMLCFRPSFCSCICVSFSCKNQSSSGSFFFSLCSICVCCVSAVSLVLLLYFG